MPSPDVGHSEEQLLAPGDTAALLRTTDWSLTPLGPIDLWPKSLLAYVDMIMSIPTPAVIFWGPSQTQIYNDGYAVIMGPRHPRFFGAPYRESWPDTYPVIYPHMRRVLDLGETWSVERAYIPVTRHGFDEETYFSFTFSPLRNDEGVISGILQPVFEVTETVLSERRAETLRQLIPGGTSAARSLEAALAAIATNPDDMPFCRIWFWDAEKQTLSLAGHVGERLDDATQATLKDQALRVQGDAKIEIKSLRNDRWQSVQMLPLGELKGSGHLGVIAIGVSAHLSFDHRYREFLDQVAQHFAAGLERDLARQAEARHQQFLAGLFQQAPAGIGVTHGAEHVFDLVNPIYGSILGDGHLLGRSAREAIPQFDTHPLMRALDDVYRSGRPYVGSEVLLSFYRKPGQPAVEGYFNFVFQPLLGQHGETDGILHFCYEVTGQVKARLQAENLTAELQREQSRKDDFLAMLAHELRNPLAPISAAAHLIRMGGYTEDKLRRTADIVARQVDHMTGLVDDLLDASRVTRGIVSIQSRPQHLSDVILTAVEQIRPLAEHKRHRLTLDIAEGPVMVQGDRKRLIQVVANLLDNAVKYSPDGSAISVSLKIEGTIAVVTVTDSGDGIPSHLLPRVFDLFVQGERTADRREGGLGIGLALVKSLVELHGGTVQCASGGLGFGTTFTVCLPLHQVAEAKAAPLDSRDAAVAADARLEPVAHRRILIVDDNVDAADTLAMLLEDAGHRTWVENHPSAALTRAAEVAPDTCLLDVGLPDIDGYELAQRLRQLPQLSQSLLIAVTGYGQANDRQRAKDAGFDHFFVKPLDIQALTEVLADAS